MLREFYESLNCDHLADLHESFTGDIDEGCRSQYVLSSSHIIASILTERARGLCICTRCSPSEVIPWSFQPWQ